MQGSEMHLAPKCEAHLTYIGTGEHTLAEKKQEATGMCNSLGHAILGDGFCFGVNPGGKP